MVILFLRTFTAEGQHKPAPRAVLDAALAEPQELSGLLNKALDGLAIAGINDEVQAVAIACNNEADGIRTRNPRIDSPIL